MFLLPLQRLSVSDVYVCMAYGIRPYSRGGLTSGRRSVVKIIADSLSQHDEKHVVPTPIAVGKGRKKKKVCMYVYLSDGDCSGPSGASGGDHAQADACRTARAQEGRLDGRHRRQREYEQEEI
jgi:hypothetical protein